MTKVEVKKLISETILNCAFIDRSPNEIAAAYPDPPAVCGGKGGWFQEDPADD